MQTSSAGLNRNVRGAPEYCACASFGAATARQASDRQLAMIALIDVPPLYFLIIVTRASLWTIALARAPPHDGAASCVDTSILSLSLLAAVSTSKPFDTTSSARMRPSMIFEIGSLPDSMSPMMRGHIVMG